MNFEETIQYLYSRLPMFSRVGASAYNPSLNNIRNICAALDQPHQQFKSIHIAGTNGKGSASHMLASIFQTAGYKTGLYTSPHLRDFRERIKINGQWINADYVISFTEQCRELIDQYEPSFFELTVGMAFSWFAENKVDIAIIETGMGGRLDSTNIIEPELSVITNIGWDHMQILGNSLPEIAAEKAGIIKARKPVVIGETNPETQEVFVQKAATEQAEIFFADQERNIQEWSWENNFLQVTVLSKGVPDAQIYALDLTGVYQTHNLLTVLEAVHQMRIRGWKIDADHIREGLKKVRAQTGLHGRWETISRNPTVILDVAHNVDGIKQVLSQLEWMQFHQLHIVIGMVRDKDIDRVLTLLPATATYYFTRAQIPRALPEDQLQEKSMAFGLKGKHYPEVNAALSDAVMHAREDDLVLVCGSVFLIGEVDTARFS